MNNNKCEILSDSKNTFGNRITTFKLTYPRIVHAELMTHRMFSRNAASSRAVPISKMIESVKNNMFIPLAVQKAHKGMQGTEYFEDVELEQAKQLWIESAELALQQAEKMKQFGITKQLINRILEPYQYYQVLVTATEFENFFELRLPKYVIGNTTFRSKEDGLKTGRWLYDNKLEANENGGNLFISTETGEVFPDTLIEWLECNQSQADIHIQAIAELMWDAMNESTPKQLQAGEYHIPFGDNIDITDKFAWDNSTGDLIEAKIKIATARCARISYETLGDNPKIDYEADLKLHDRLLAEGHMSPFEHCARAMDKLEYEAFVKTVKDKMGYPWQHGWCDNYRGFISYRNLIG